MELRQLQHFLAVVRAGNYARAAEGLGVTQPAVTASVAKLEKSIGSRLLDRGRFGAHPTEAGRTLARHAELVFAQLSTAEHEIAAIDDARSGGVAVGAGAPFAYRILPEAIANLNRRFPAIQVTAVEGLSHDLFERVLRGELDFAVSTPPASLEISPELEQDRLFEDRHFLVVAQDHPLAEKDEVGLTDLTSFPWVMSYQHSTMRQRIVQLFGAHGLPAPSVVVNAQSIALVKSLLLRGQYLALLGNEAVGAEEQLGTHVRVDLPELSFPRVACLTYRRRGGHSRAADTLMDAVRRECASAEVAAMNR